MATTKSATASGPRAPHAGGELGVDLERFDTELRTFVKERPILALLSAVAAGYLVGRILRRRV